MMRILVLAAACALASAAAAEDAVPDLIGTWVGTAKSVVLGETRFHPGDEAETAKPRVRELEWTMEIAGQDGRVFWGEAWSTADPTVRDTLALALAADGRTIIGAGNDGAHHMTLVSPDRIERCFAQPGTGPSGAIVAACGYYDRVK
jgi:hypothetical protein